MNVLEIGLSFVEGLALIASPCILPVLPLVLASSVDGGRRRPFGIILGFVASFTLFALFSRWLVSALRIDLDVVKYGSLLLLAVFGLILISSTLSERFSIMTQRFAAAGTTLSGHGEGGFGSGVLIGLLIGLVWTPCAGPILAAVLVQVIRQENDWQGLFIIAAFALGAGVPMLIIALTGRKIMQKLGFLTRHTDAVPKGFGVLILLAVAFIASGKDAQSFFGSPEAEPAAESGGIQNGLSDPYPAPEFAEDNVWLNGDKWTMAELKGKVVLIDFWTYSCINCVRTMPYITKWDRKYRDKGLVIVGVHSPEFEFEKSRENVKEAIEELGIAYPVAMDNNLSTWTNFKNRYWPAHYLIDKDGKVVYTHYGEGGYLRTENNIRTLLGLNMADGAETAPLINWSQTPETYLGYERAESFKSIQEVVPDAVNHYTLPGFVAQHGWALNGNWKINGEKIIAAEAGATLQLNFVSKKVFLVLGSATGKPLKAQVFLNGAPIGAAAGKDAPDGHLTVKRHTLYELVAQKEIGNALLSIVTEEPGLEAYAFTFGS